MNNYSLIRTFAQNNFVGGIPPNIIHVNVNTNIIRVNSFPSPTQEGGNEFTNNSLVDYSVEIVRTVSTYESDYIQ